MSQFLVATRPVAQAPARVNDRRRPGRIENASPELIALMRKPNRAARLRVALYDAPGFVLPTEHRRPSLGGRGMAHMALAMAGCSAGCAAAFKTMLILWG